MSFRWRRQSHSDEAPDPGKFSKATVVPQKWIKLVEEEVGLGVELGAFGAA